MKPAITITEKSIRVSTDAFEMSVLFTQNHVTLEALKVDSPRQPSTSVTYKPRVCEVCKSEYIPTGPSQRFCSAKCKSAGKRKTTLSEMEEPELDKSLKEIEQRRKHYPL
jgi:hypothetical protein